MSTPPNGFSESWYVKTQRELGELHTQVTNQQTVLQKIQDGQDRMEQRLDAHGARLAQVAMGAVVAALLIPIIPDMIMLFRDSQQSVHPPHNTERLIT